MNSIRYLQIHIKASTNVKLNVFLSKLSITHNQSIFVYFVLVCLFPLILLHLGRKKLFEVLRRYLGNWRLKMEPEGWFLHFVDCIVHTNLHNSLFIVGVVGICGNRSICVFMWLCGKCLCMCVCVSCVIMTQSENSCSFNCLVYFCLSSDGITSIGYGCLFIRFKLDLLSFLFQLSFLWKIY